MTGRAPAKCGERLALGLKSHSWWPQHHVGWGCRLKSGLGLPPSESVLSCLTLKPATSRNMTSKLSHHGTILFPTSGCLEQ